MTAFRVTQRSASSTMMQGLQANLGRMQKLQEQLSSGRRISRPSDAPVATAEAMQFRGELRRTEQYSRNAADGLAWLGTADAALTGGLELTRRAKELTLQGINATGNTQGRLALAAEIDSLRAGLLDIANTSYLDRPVFAGTAAVAVAYLPDGTSTGDGGSVTRSVAPGTTVGVNVAGTEVFGADGDPTQLFTVLSELATALRDPDGAARQVALDGGLADLDTAVDRVVSSLGQIGARYDRVETLRNRADDQLITLTGRLSETEDIDLPKTIVDLQMQEVAYQAALGATARVVQPSLLDFLR
ncbi:MAG: Flagellar hook-associated protein FlgL [Frankiales bacterium]|nr:Flagellar hook-associated protein FlgL [Frankiales bacterium]